jgi:methylated-DNA-protein-cysteine methyltransferase related protein
MSMKDKNDDGFFTRVYELTRKIPQGRVTSYVAIARFLGSAGSARMVGWALHHSENSGFYIPAHRVVNRSGILSGKHHFPGQNMMKELLESEGLVIEDDQILNFEDHFWDPNKELI